MIETNLWNSGQMKHWRLLIKIKKTSVIVVQNKLKRINLNPFVDKIFMKFAQIVLKNGIQNFVFFVAKIKKDNLKNN